MIHLDTKEVVKNGTEQIELRFHFHGGTTVQVVVGLKGWNYKSETPVPTERTPQFASQHCSHNTEKFNVRFSMNGLLYFSFEDWEEFMNQVDIAIDGAKKELMLGIAH